MKNKSAPSSFKKVRVGRSSAGLGLFADESIKRGEKIIEYTGEMISREEADRRGGKYLFEISKNRVVDGTPRSNTARYANHSCAPNAETDIVGGRIYLYATKAIKPGEEIAYDYGKEYMEDIIKPIGCKCAVCSPK